MKATEQYFPVVLFFVLYKLVRTFESVDKILKCEHSNESYRASLSFTTVNCTAVNDVFTDNSTVNAWKTARQSHRLQFFRLTTKERRHSESQCIDITHLQVNFPS